MILTIRPSKTFQFGILARTLVPITGPVGLDAASAGFKNRRMFRTGAYYGIDIDLLVINAGLARFNDGNTLGIHADLAHLERLPTGSADAIVSTNTIYHLAPSGQHLTALAHLCRITAPTGTFIFDLPIQLARQDVKNILLQTFGTVKTIYFRNIISRAYESIFEKNGYLGSHPIAGSKPFLALSWLISRFEYLTCHLPNWNDHVYFICTKKIDQTKNSFDLTNVPTITDRLYDLL